MWESCSKTPAVQMKQKKTNKKSKLQWFQYKGRILHISTFPYIYEYRSPRNRVRLRVDFNIYELISKHPIEGEFNSTRLLGVWDAGRVSRIVSAPLLPAPLNILRILPQKSYQRWVAHKVVAALTCSRSKFFFFFLSGRTAKRDPPKHNSLGCHLHCSQGLCVRKILWRLTRGLFFVFHKEYLIMHVKF